MAGITPYGDEPAVREWSVHRWADVLASITPDPPPVQRPIVLAVDGHSGSGKTTAATRLAAQLPGSVVVHTDDVAWWESFFDWDALMRDGILAPIRRGESVSYRPPAWDARQRPGAIAVPAGAPLVIVEGVGASRRPLAPYLDASIWVQSDYDEANRRGIARDAASGQGPDFWWEWMAAENPFLMDDRPWDRAAAVVCGTPDLVALAHDAEHEVLRGSLEGPGSIKPPGGPSGPQHPAPEHLAEREVGGA